MVVEWIFGLLTWLVGLLPAWSPIGFLPDLVSDAAQLPVIGQALGIILWLDHYLPVAEALQLLTGSGALLLVGSAFSGMMWLWRNLPGKAT